MALAALICLAGCGRQGPRAPFTDSRIPPGVEHRFYPPTGWAWGLVKVGDAPPARYGVSAPPRRPRADVVILASYGEPAEVWFETAAALNGRGYVVWVLEPVGQGGSGRYVLPRDLGHAPGFDVDAVAARAMVERFVRRRPVILMASRSSAGAALDTVRAGLPVEGLILSAPAIAPDSGVDLDKARMMARIQLGWLRADGAGGWRRDGPDDRALGLTHDADRGRLRLAWETANPDLRMGGPTWSWRAAFADEARREADARFDRVATPVLILQPDKGSAAAKALCARFTTCTTRLFGPADAALHLEADDVRQAWLTAISDFIEADIARFAPPPAQARLAPEG